jgi:hypothetical protein
MATKKKFKPKKPPVSEPQLYAAFIGDTLAGDVRPKKLEDARDAYGILAFDYEEAE